MTDPGGTAQVGVMYIIKPKRYLLAKTEILEMHFESISESIYSCSGTLITLIQFNFQTFITRTQALKMQCACSWPQSEEQALGLQDSPFRFQG